MSDWPVKFTRPVRLKDDTMLLSLSDARDCVLKHFVGVTKYEQLVHAIVLMMKAAETKTRKDRRARPIDWGQPSCPRCRSGEHFIRHRIEFK
jgi:hypothetical protein